MLKINFDTFFLFQMLTKFKVHGLVADMMPNITLMKIFGFPLFNYYEGESCFFERKYFSAKEILQFILTFGFQLQKTVR